jgi:hypothetical protein
LLKFVLVCDRIAIPAVGDCTGSELPSFQMLKKEGGMEQRFASLCRVSFLLGSGNKPRRELEALIKASPIRADVTLASGVGHPFSPLWIRFLAIESLPQA